MDCRRWKKLISIGYDQDGERVSVLFKHFVSHSKAELHTHKYTIQKIYYR